MALNFQNTMTEKTDVNTAPVSEGAVREDVSTQGQEGAVPEATPPQPVQAGEKTDPALLLKSLQEEREKRRLLEEELNNLKASAPPETDDVLSDEGRVLHKRIEELGTEIRTLRDNQELDAIVSKYPALKEVLDDFNDFRKDYPRHNTENVAKLFLVEKGLMEAPVRKGLEKQTGGPRTPVSSGMSAQDVENLRKSDFRKYTELLKSGQLKISV